LMGIDGSSRTTAHAATRRRYGTGAERLAAGSQVLVRLLPADLPSVVAMTNEQLERLLPTSMSRRLPFWRRDLLATDVGRSRNRLNYRYTGLAEPLPP